MASMDAGAVAEHDHNGAPPCAIHELLNILGNRWTVLVLIELGDHGTTRSADLKRAVPGISQKVLTDCLRRLQRLGLVQRIVVDTVPVSVSYELTSTGRNLFEVMSPLRRWADDHVDRLEMSASTGTRATISAGNHVGAGAVAAGR